MPLPQNRYDPQGFTTPGSYAIPQGENPGMAAAIQMLAALGSAAGLGSALAAGPIIAGPKSGRMLEQAWDRLPERIKAILSKGKVLWYAGTPEETGFPTVSGLTNFNILTRSPGRLTAHPEPTNPLPHERSSMAHELVHAAQAEVGAWPEQGQKYPPLPALTAGWPSWGFENFRRGYSEVANQSKMLPEQYGVSIEALPKLLSRINPDTNVYGSKITPQQRDELLMLLEMLGRGGNVPPQVQRFRAARAGQEW